MKRLLVIGGGEHARVVIEAARSSGEWSVLGFCDPRPCAETASRLGIERLGGDEVLATLGREELWFLVGVGAVGVSPRRREVVERIGAAVRWATIVHARAWVSPTARLGPGVVVMAGAQVNSGAQIDAHCVINTGAIVEHDVHLGAFCQLGPGAAVGGGAAIGSGSYLGLGSRVRDHIEIGEEVTIGMGAVVVGSVGARQRLIGVPAKALTP